MTFLTILGVMEILCSFRLVIQGKTGICNTAIYADLTTLHYKCDQPSDQQQQLKLTDKLESDLQQPVDWGRKWLVDFNAEKTQLVLFDWSKNTGGIYMKMDRPVLEKKFKDAGVGLDQIGAPKLSLLLKLPPRKLEP